MHRASRDLSDPSRNLEESNPSPANQIAGMDVDIAMSPEDEEWNDQADTRRVYTPPPRIAARFYRPSQARRKDSAASSRRNSISSAQSRCSSMHSHDVSDQSKYVAQHLRRASFLADRQARLADRAAHAEKVRLRAALAKATPRGTQTSEERALAAQQARERNLAEIAANCAEEVKKAKQIAEHMKEKREQELAKLRAQIDERMADAEKRREEFRSRSFTRKSRGHSLAARKTAEVLAPVVEQSPMRLSEGDAARRIQCWWRGLSRSRAIKSFSGLGLTVDGIRDTSFETVVELLAREEVLTTVAHLLRICGLREGDSGSVDEMTAVRTFLSAFLILGHPNQVLSNKGDGSEAGTEDGDMTSHRLQATDLENPQLQDLIGKAKDLLIGFENILSRLTVANYFTVPRSLDKTLPEAYAVFFNAFIAWKSRDSNALVEVMLMQFVELDAILQTVTDSTDIAAAALYRQSIKDSQLMLIVRIKKLAGPEKGKKMIFAAVAEARKKAKQAKKQVGDTKPRVADDGPGEPTKLGASSLASPQPQPQMMTPPPTPSRKEKEKLAITKTGFFGLLADNRFIVHELAISKEYQISAEDFKRESALSVQPFYDRLRTDLGKEDANIQFRFFMGMISSIRSKLQRLLKEGNSMYNLIGEILDPELAERQFSLGNFSYEKFFTAIGSLLPKLCAPFRDDEVKELVQNKLREGSLIDRVELLNAFIDTMLCDYTNYLLRSVAPQLIELSAQYEAKRFTEDIETGKTSLVVAEAAWKSARANVMAEAQRRDPEGINHPKARPTARRIYAQMLVDVFTQPTPIDVNTIPEMLRLNTARVTEVSLTVQRLVIVGALLLQCKNLLKRDVRSPWKTEASRILTVIQANHASLDTALEGIMAALEAGRSMPAATKSHIRAFTRKVLAAGQEMSQHGTEPREPVMRLLLTRLRGNILARLSPSSAGEKVKAATVAGEKLATLGLSEFVDKVRHVSDLLDKVGAVDRAAHSPWWDAVATKVEQDELQLS